MIEIQNEINNLLGSTTPKVTKANHKIFEELLVSKTNTELETLENMLNDTVEGYKGNLTLLSAAPTEVGYYIFSESGSAPAWLIGYTDVLIGGIVYVTFVDPDYIYSYVDNTDVVSTNLQTLTTNQKDIARENINANEKITDYVNIYNKATSTLDKLVNYAYGYLMDFIGFISSDFIPCVAGQKISISHVRNYCFFNAAGETLGGANTAVETGYVNITITAPANAASFRFSFYNSPNVADEVMVNIGEVFYDYVPYGKLLLSSLIFDAGSNSLLPAILQKLISELKINMPTKLYGVVGKEINIYFDNILNDDYKNVGIKAFSDNVNNRWVQQDERLTFVPDTTYASIKTEVHGYKNNQLSAQSLSYLTVKAASVGTGVNRKILVLGDSIVGYGWLLPQLSELFNADPMDVTFLGIRGANPNWHEGRGGWRAVDYATAADYAGYSNPFYNPTTEVFDFEYYMIENGYTDVDHVIINLGINDMVLINSVFNPYTPEAVLTYIDEVLAHFDTIVNSIHAFDADIKVGINITIPPSYEQNAFGKVFKSGQWRFIYKMLNHLLVEKMIAKYDNRTDEKIYLIPTHMALDTIHNMITESVQVNSRNTALITRQSDHVHPAESGFGQIADTIYYYLKSFES